MASKKSIHGIFLAVELDKDALAKMSEDLLRELERTNQKIHKTAAITPKLDSTGMQKTLQGMLASLTKVKEHANNLGQVLTKLPAILSSNDSELKKQFNAVGKYLGMSGEKFKGIFEKSFKAGEIKNIVSSFEGFRRAVGMTKDEILELIEGMKGIPLEAVEALRTRYEKTASSMRSSLDTVKSAIKGVSESMVSIGKANNMYATLQQMPALKAEMDELSKSGRISKKEMENFLQAAAKKEAIDNLISSLKLEQEITHKTDEEIRNAARSLTNWKEVLSAVDNAFSSQGKTIDDLNAKIEKIKGSYSSLDTSIEKISHAENFKQLVAGNASLQKNIDELSQVMGKSTQETTTWLQGFLKNEGIKETISLLERIQKEQQLTNDQTINAAKIHGVQGEALDAVIERFSVYGEVLKKVRNVTASFDSASLNIKDFNLADNLSAYASGNKNISSEIQSFSGKLGKNAKDTEEFISRALKTESINNIVSALENLKQKYGATNDEVLTFAKNEGLVGDALDEVTKHLTGYVSIMDIAKNKIAELRESSTSMAEAMSTLSDIKYTVNSSANAAGIADIAKKAGISSSQDVADKITEIITDEQIKKIEKAKNELRLTDEQVVELAKNSNLTSEAMRSVTDRFTEIGRVSSSLIEKVDNVNTAIAHINEASNLSSTSAEVQDLAAKFGSTSDEAKELLASIIKVGNERSILDFFNQLKEDGELNNKQIMQFAENMQNLPVDVLEKLQSQFTEVGKATEELSKGFENVQEAIDALGEADALTEQSKEVKKLSAQYKISTKDAKELIQAQMRLGNEKKVIEHFIALRDATGKTNKEILAMAKNMGVTGTALSNLTSALRHTQKGFFALIRDLATTNNMAAALQSVLATIGMNISLAGITELIKSMYRTNVELNTLSVAFQSVQGDAFEAGAKLEFIRKECDTLGLHFMETARAAKNFYAAANQSEVAKDADKIFHAFTSAATALHLTKEETSGMFLALSQMMSKGKITAEELRQQLGERLPGAVQILAKAMNVTTQQLDKMLQNGQVGLENLVKMADAITEQYGIAAQNASGSIIAETNRLANAWMDFKQKFNLAENFAGVISTLKSLVEFFTEWGHTIFNVGLLLGELATTGFFVTKIVTGLVGKLAGLKAGFEMAAMTGGVLVNVFKTMSLSAAGLKAAGLNLAALFGVTGTGLSTAIAGWLGLAGVIGTVAYTLYTWYDRTHQASEGLKNLEKTYNSIRFEKKEMEIEVNGIKTKKEAIEKSSEQLVKDLQDFWNKRKAELEVGVKVDTEKLEDLKEDLRQELSLGDFADTTKVKELTDEINKLESNLKNLHEQYDNANNGQADFMNQAINLANEVKNGNMEKEEAIEKLKNLQTEYQNSSNASDQYKAAIQAAIPAIISLINQNNALAASLGGVAQAMRNLSLAADGMYKGIDFVSETARITAENALTKTIGKGGAVDKKIASGLASKYGGSAKDLYDAAQKGDRQAVQKIIENDLRADKNFSASLNNVNPIARSSAVSLEASIKAEKFWKDYDAITPYRKALEEQAALKKTPKGGGGSKGGSKKTKSGGSGKSEKSQMAQTKKDTGVEDTLQALQREEKLLKQIQNIGEDNSVARAFLEIEEAISKANLAADKYAATNLNASDQAKVKAVTDLMRSNAEIKAKTKINKLLEDEHKKILELTSAYNEQQGVHNDAKIELINQKYQKQIEELDTLIEKYKKAGDAKAAFDAEEAKKVVKKNEAREKLFEEKGLGASFKQAFVEYEEKYADITAQMKDIWSGSLDSMGEALADFISSGDLSFSSLAESFHSLAKSILADMTKVMMHQFVRYFIGAIGGMFGGTEGGGYPVGGYSDSGLTSRPIYGAKGGVFGGGSLSSYTNSIVNTPTMFSYGTQRFAKGGIMGEAGPEAIMPLTRTANGNLGVRAVGNGSDNVTVNVYNYGNEKARTRESRNSQGGRSIDVIIGDITAQQMTTPGTKLNRAVAAQTGASQPTIRR